MGVNIFQNTTKKLPESDAQIIRVDMEQIDIGGRKSQLQRINGGKSSDLTLSHVPNASTAPGQR